MADNIYCIKYKEKYPISITLHDRDNDRPIDLTNAIIHFSLKDELKDDFFVIDKTITEDTDVYTDGRIVDPKNGKIITRLTDDDYDKLVCERIYYLVIKWDIPDQDFSKIISSNCNEVFKFVVHYQ